MSSAGDALVRPAILADARAMAEVHVRSYRRFYRGILPDEALMRHSVDDRYAEWRQVIEEGIGASRAAIVDDRIVGVCFAHNEPQDRDLPEATGEVYTLFVDPEHIGTGCGWALLDDTLQAFREHGHTSAVLWCLEGNDLARRFYERQGWSLDPSALPRQIGPYEDVREVRYRIDLGGGEAVRTIVGTG